MFTISLNLDPEKLKALEEKSSKERARKAAKAAKPKAKKSR